MQKLSALYSQYPRQFWLLFGGMLISAAGSSMVWPFLTIYLREKLDLPLTTIALILTVNSAASLISMSIAGPVADRFGRKGVMVTSLFSSSIIYCLMIWAGSLSVWAILMALQGAAGPMFRVGSNAMVADMVVTEKRANAYALLRMVNNVGVAIGPSVGGFLAAISYSIVFGIAAAASLTFALFLRFFIHETLASHSTSEEIQNKKGTTGYRQVLQDRAFLAFCGIYAIAGMGYVMVMVLLPVYAKENFNIIENQYGLIMATNAVMVVIFQYSVTNLTKRYRELLVMSTGTFFYLLGLGVIFLASDFPTFILSMVILTIGEMIIIPTSTTYTANLAPPDMRARYMSIYGLTFGIALGVGPVIGGYLYDHIAPGAIWIGGMSFSALGIIGFLLLNSMTRPNMRQSV